MSHTAGIANNDTVFEKTCVQAGSIRLNSISEPHSLPKILTSMPLLKGKRIAVFTNSGAFGGISADLLVVPSLWHPMVIEAIKELVAKCHKYANPAAICTPNPAEKTINYRQTYNVPLFESPEEAARALEVSYRQYCYLQKKENLLEVINQDC